MSPVCTSAVILLLIALSCSSVTESKYLTYYTKYVDDYCGKTLSLASTWGDYGILKYSSDGYFSGDIQCTITLDTSSLYNTQVVYLAVEKYNIECNGKGYVRFYDGTTTSPKNQLDEIKAGEFSYTGSSKFRTTSRYMTIVHNLTDLYVCSKSDLYQIRYTTQTKDGYCISTNQFTCDNDYCINELQKCDDYDNCGDNSDEATWMCDYDDNTDGISVAGWIGIITITIIFVGFIFAASVFRYRRHHILSHTTVIQPGQPTTVTCIPQGITNPNYISGSYPPQPQQYLGPPPNYTLTSPPPLQKND